MDRVKIIIRRPLNHYLIIGIYILAPLGNILIVRLIGQVPFQDISRNFFNGFGLFSGIWLLTAPLVGAGFYFVHKTTWYLFIGHSTLILIDYIYKWISRPVYFMKTLSGAHNSFMFLGNLILILIVGYVIQKNFRAPYFQALQRHWRESIRIPIHHLISINRREMEVNDLSTGGCFVLKSGEPLSVNPLHDISFDSDKLHITCKGQIMRQTDTGYGIMFKELETSQKKDIAHFLKKRFSLRHKVDLVGEWQNDGLTRDVRLLDFSKGGCFLQANLKGLNIDDKGIVCFKINDSEYKLHATITWINQEGLHKKPEGFGCSFRWNHKNIMKAVIDECGMSELTR